MSLIVLLIEYNNFATSNKDINNKDISSRNIKN